MFEPIKLNVLFLFKMKIMIMYGNTINILNIKELY